MSLQSNIIQLAKSEHDTHVQPLFIRTLRLCPDDDYSLRIILAADRLIGYLFTYGQHISIGERYFQPCLEDYPQYVSFNWGRRTAKAFCAGCPLQEWHCNVCPFSSRCLRFKIAHAAEHVIAGTNCLLRRKNV